MYKNLPDTYSSIYFLFSRNGNVALKKTHFWMSYSQVAK